MLFDNWFGLLRVLIVGSLAYLTLVLLLRTSGKRTLAKMNAFDFVVTVALGSTLATVLLSNSVALAEGILAFCLLTGMQYLITWLSVRSPTVRRLVKSEPGLLFHNGDFLFDTMKRERVTEDEVLAAMRQQGKGSLGKVGAVVLETDGTFSIIAAPEGPASTAAQDRSTLQSVHSHHLTEG